jgi:hypothetical protein
MTSWRWKRTASQPLNDEHRSHEGDGNEACAPTPALPGGTFVPVLLLIAIREICVTTTGNAKRRTNEVFLVQPTAAEVLNTLSVKIPMPPTRVLSATAALLDGSGRTGL